MNLNLPFPHKQAEPLSDYSTFGIGGPARYLSEAKSIEQMQEMLSFCHHHKIPYLILGKGSNCLFDDRGFNGLVILNRIDYLEQTSEGMFRAGSGYSFARLGGITAKQGWTGLEFASGIPATVGGAIYMNAGANGRETFNSLMSVVYIKENGESTLVKKENLSFSYRWSCFQAMKGAIVEGTFQLQASPEAKKSQKEIVGYRLKTQPYGEKSAGCAFRNPTQMPAGKLIELCGLKGTTIGGASISSLHGNFIVNQGGASAQDVLTLMKLIKEKIYSTQGILLEEEIRLVPYEF